MADKIGVAILGCTGYGAGELLRLFTYHPHVEVVSVVSRSQVGAPITDAHPHLAGFYDLKIASELDLESLRKYPMRALISALPHGKSGETLAQLADKLEELEIKAIDLSGDFRLQDKGLHTKFYADSPFAGDLRSRFVYGLPEYKGSDHPCALMGKDAISKASFVANPGCLATAAILSVLPLFAHEIKGTVVFDTKTGSSGSGRELKTTTHHPTRHGNFSAYKPLSHQHEPEIMQALGDPFEKQLSCSFVAQSLPLTRGIFVTTHLELAKERSTDELVQSFREYYSCSPFIRMRKDSPHLQNIFATNFCDISVHSRERKVIVMTAMDNLVKGMSGQAIQNLNLMFGLPQETGLMQPAPRPV